MKKINLKRSVSLIYLILIAALLSMLPVNVKAGGAILSVIPENNVFYVDTTSVNDTFVVNATVTNVTDLWNWQVKLLFNASILHCVSASVPSDSPFNFPIQPTPVIDNTTGFVMLGASMLTGPGIDGNGTLATLTFKIMSAPSAPGESLTCNFTLDDVDTYLNDSGMVPIPATLEDGYYEYLRPLPPYPYLEVKPSVYNATALGEDVTIDIWVGNVTEEWNITGFQLVLGFNATLLDPVNYTAGTFMEGFANDGETILYIDGHDFIGDPNLLPGYNAWVVGVFTMPGSGNVWHEPFAEGEGLLVSLHFNATLATAYLEIVWTDLNFTYLEANPLNPNDDITCYAMDTNMNEIPFEELIGGSYRVPYTCNLTITASVGGTTDPEPREYTYPVGTNVTVTAIPNEFYILDHWMLDGSDVGVDNPITVTMDADHTLHAVFVVIPPPEIVEVKQDPLSDNVLAGQAVKVSVNVTDYGTDVKNVTLTYTTDNWTTPMSLSMDFNGTSGFWEIEILGQDLDTLVQYKVEAYDYAGNYVVDNNAGFYYVYTVIPEFAIITFLIALLVATLSAAILTKHSKKPIKLPN